MVSQIEPQIRFRVLERSFGVARKIFPQTAIGEYIETNGGYQNSLTK